MLPVTLSVNYPDWFVCALGVGTVFVGLVCIIILCSILNAFCRLGKNRSETKTDVAAASPAEPAKSQGPVVIPNRRETIAAVAAAIAEDLGTDISAIRIVSIEKM